MRIMGCALRIFLYRWNFEFENIAKIRIIYLILLANYTSCATYTINFQYYIIMPGRQCHHLTFNKFWWDPYTMNFKGPKSKGISYMKDINLAIMFLIHTKLHDWLGVHSQIIFFPCRWAHYELESEDILL